MKSILDPSFKYYPAAATDVRRTIERVKERMAQEKREKEEKDYRIVAIGKKRNG